MALTVENVKLKAALVYAHVWRLAIFPLHDMADGTCSCGEECGRGGKHPRIAGWQKEATTSERKIRRWWDHWPNANIGIPTGDANGLFVLDADNQEGLDELVSLIGELPAPTTVSARGLPHYWFRFPEGADMTNRRGRLPLGIDVRGNGGYVVAPPSVSHRGEYRWSTDYVIELAEPPEKLLDLLKPAQNEKKLVDPNTVTWYDALPNDLRGRVADYVANAIDAEMHKIELLGCDDEWDNESFKIDCNLVELDIAPWSPGIPDLEDRILKANAGKYDNEGWTETRVLKKLESARKKVLSTGQTRPEPDWLVEALRQQTNNGPVVELSAFSDIKATPLEWYEEPWLPVKGLRGLAGPPDTGKSTMFIHEMAKLTTGGYGKPPISVIYLFKEDDESVVKARLKLAGADLSKVYSMKIREKLDEMSYTRDVMLKEDLKRLEQELKRHSEIKAIYIDPGNSFLGINEDKDGSSEIRATLERVQHFARTNEILMCVMKHTRKDSKDLDKLPVPSLISGYQAWSEVIRIFPILWPVNEKLHDKLGLDPFHDRTNLIMLRGKNNYAPHGLRAQQYRIDAESLMMDDAQFQNVTRLEYLGTDANITQEKFQDSKGETQEEQKSREKQGNKTDEFLRETLVASLLRKVVIELYEKKDIGTVRTLKNRAKALGVPSTPVPGSNEVMWGPL
ncbi:bifunctional DNA primase/polymerase [Nonomuraea sp. NPDC049028]|uniref:bifunctional DNA primase/polymerase n=1 Tax=Nonomuraea sp. NPDC049028 TaxID=3364348 RepID=UPI003712B157